MLEVAVDQKKIGAACYEEDEIRLVFCVSKLITPHKFIVLSYFMQIINGTYDSRNRKWHMREIDKP